LRFHIDLRNTSNSIFDRFFNGDDPALHRIDATEKAIKRGRFAAASRAGEKNDSIGLGKKVADDLFLLLAQIEPLKIELLLAAAEQAQTDRFAIDSWYCRNAHIDLLIICEQVHSTILGQSPLGDVHVRHHFQARDDGRLQDAQLRRHSNFVQNSVYSISNPQIVFERLDMNVGRALHDGFPDDLVYEFHHGGFRIVGIQLDGGFGVLQDLKGPVCFKDLIERFRADAIESLDRAEKLGTGHQHPLGRFLQKLRSELAAYGIEQIVGSKHDRIFLCLDGQDVVLKNETARQDRQCRAVDLLGIDRDNRHTKEVT